MKQPKLALTVLAVLGALAAQAHADDALPITVSGFGTGALTMTDTNDGLFNRTNQVGGAGKSARTGVDSNLGLQMTAKLSDSLSLTAQGLVRKNGPSDQYAGEMAWAFAKYKASDEISFRVGRIGLPVYMISDVRNVGYANIMMRAPNEVYRQVTADNIDGADVLYQHNFGETTVTGQLAVGRTRFHASGNYDVEFKPAVSAQVVLENGPFTYRLGHAKAKVNVYDNANLSALLAALNKYGLTSVSAQLPLSDIDGTFTSAGFAMDYNNIVLQGEYAKRKTETRAIQDTSSYYLMGGYRMGKFLPYVMYGDVKQDSIRSFASLPTTGPLAGLTAAANGAIQAGLQSTTAIGVRWDFYKSAAFKFQIDHISTRDGTGYFANATPALAGKSVNVYAAGIDFVF